MNRYAVLLTALFITGCAQSNERYPSLALRPIETRSDAEPIVPTPVATPDAALDAKLAGITSTLATIDADFTAGAAKANAAARVPAARTTGSDPWLTAQTSLAEIEGLRGDTQGVVGDVERMVTDRGVAGQPPYPALDDLHAKAQSQLDAEIARIAAVKAAMGEK